MEKIDIVGKNYFGYFNKSRIACRALIIKNNQILLNYETKTNQYMIPGGGLEDNESEKECVVREVSEETGNVIMPSDLVLEINEYYEDYKFISKYYFGDIVDTSKIMLTDREKEVGLEYRWENIDEAIKIFSKYEKYETIDEMRRGMYLREYTALTKILRKE